jgi:hypothetical protein
MAAGIGSVETATEIGSAEMAIGIGSAERVVATGSIETAARAARNTEATGKGRGGGMTAGIGETEKKDGTASIAAKDWKSVVVRDGKNDAAKDGRNDAASNGVRSG